MEVENEYSPDSIICLFPVTMEIESDAWDSAPT